MPDPQDDTGPSGPFAQARRLLEGQEQRGMEALPEAAARLRPVAPDLERLIASSSVRAHTESYPRCDLEALRQQKLLVREATLANLCLLGAGVLSGVVLARAAIQGWLGLDPTIADRIVLALGLLTLALGAMAAMFSYQAREGDRLRRWLAMRATAEMARLDTFRAIAQGAQASPQAAAAGLALILRHLFDHQRDWLITAAKRHRRSSERTNLWGGLATALAFVGGSGAVIASQQQQSLLPLAGVIGAAIAAYALSRESLRRDRTNADRYEKALVALDQLAAKLDPVVAEIEAGQPAALPAFVDAVTAQLEAEHKQWLDGVTQAEAALATLDARLKELGGTKPAG